jgi:hypothetical protein
MISLLQTIQREKIGYRTPYFLNYGFGGLFSWMIAWLALERVICDCTRVVCEESEE